MARHYPISLDLEGRRCLVVGGGAVAERKVSGLREAGAQVRVVSPALSPGLQALAHSGQIEVQIAAYDVSSLEGVCLVIAATDRREVNAQVGADAQARKIPVNVADSLEASSFVVPAVVRSREFCLSNSTGGKS